MILWVENPSGSGSQTLVLLVEAQRGFSNAVRFSNTVRQSALLDGPYGVSRRLDRFDKVLFFASGVGISAHLLYIRDLLDAHSRKSARTRRLSLVWLVEADGITLTHQSLFKS